MHVMHVIDTLRVGGAERCLVALTRAAAQAGVETSVCLTRSQPVLADELPAGTRLTQLGRTRRYEWGPFRRFGEVIRSSGADLLHVHCRSPFAFVAAAKSLGMASPPTVFHDHSGAPPPRSLLMRTALRHCAAGFASGAESSLGWARRAGLSDDRIVRIAAAVELRGRPFARGDIRAALGLPAKALVASAIGNLRPEKGYNTLFEALALAPLPAEFRLVVFGADRDEAHARVIRARAQQLGLERVVVFAGERRDANVLAAGGDFAVHAARVESGPLALAEHLAAGLATVYTRVGAIAAEAEQTGIPGSVDAGNARTLRGALDELIAMSPQERRERGRQGRELALARFDIGEQIGKWLALYRRALEAG